MKTNQLVTIHDHQAVTTSQTISQFFGKRHIDVLNVVRRIEAQCPEGWGERNFSLTSYSDAQGKSQPAYELTSRGFTLVAMSFTGEKAFQFKIAYIDAFEKMENALRKQGQAQLHASLDAVHAQEDKLQAQVSSLKDELLDSLRSHVKLLGKPQRAGFRPLTAEEKAQMRALSGQGMGINAIARQLGRARASVRNTLRGTTPTPASGQQESLFGEV